jgi:hypothetical protein
LAYRTPDSARAFWENESKLVRPRSASSASPFEQVDFSLQVRKSGELNVKLTSICDHALTDLANALLHGINESAQSFVFSTFSL